jgi:hypothetical protein
MKRLSDIYESLLSETTQTEFIAYHGSNHKIEKFSDSFVDGDRVTQHHGAGIYFATSYKNARMFGDNVYKVKLSGNFISEDNPSSDVNPDDLANLMKLSDEEEWGLEAQNYHPDVETGLRIAIKDALNYGETEADVFMRVQTGGWYMHDGLGYVRGMTKIGIDGVIVNPPKDWVNEKHIIVFNPNIIEFIGIVNLDESLNEYISQRDLDSIEDKIDTQFKPLDIDVEFSRHFLDRLNDPRNGKEIQPDELINTFNRLHYKHGKGLVNHKTLDAYISDFNNNLNIPFNLSYDKRTKTFELISKTIMRTNNFHSNDRKLKV